MIRHKQQSGVLDISFSETINKDDVDEAIRALKEHIKYARKEGIPAYVLIDLSDAKDETNGARLSAVGLLKLRYSKLAAYGANKNLHSVAEYLIGSTGSRARVSLFENRQQAQQWLETGSTNSARRFAPLVIVQALLSVAVFCAVIWIYSSAVDSQEEKQAAARATATADIQDTVNDRFQSYIDQIYGFRGLFEASEFVTHDEFKQYYDASDIKNRYPGFYAISLIRYIPNEKLADFNKQYTSDEYFRQNNIIFQTKPSDLGFTLPVAYLEPVPANNATYGADLGVSEERRQNLLRAKDTGESSFSKVFNLDNLTAPNADPKYGFFVTVPVYNDEAPREGGIPYGFINAVFGYELFYGTLFGDPKYADLSIQIERDGVIGYSSQSIDGDDTRGISTKLLSNDSVQVGFPRNYGLSPGESYLPGFILFGGALLWMMFNILLYTNYQKQRRAIELAQKMTVDLERQKQLAVTEEQKTRSILESIGDGVFAIDKEERIILFNPASEFLSGFSGEDVMGRKYSEVLKFTYEDTGKQNDTFIKKALSGNKAKMANHTLLEKKDGSMLPVADSASPIMTNEGDVVGAIIVFRDATEENELADRARQIAIAKAKDDAMLGAIAEGLVAIDPDGVVTRVNQEALGILDLPEERVTGSQFTELVDVYNFDGSKVSKQDRPSNKVISSKKTVSFVGEYETLSKKRIPVRIAISPIIIEGEYAGALELFQDITAERELDKSKDDFIGLVSHQLSTPATAVKANLGMIVEGLVSKKDDINSAVQAAYESNDRQIQIVQDFLNVARLENNRLKPNPELLSLRDFIEQIVVEQKMPLNERRHEVNIKCDKQLHINTDPHLLSFIMNNFINNASKYSASGTDIVVSVEDKDADVEIKVVDQGVGISKQDLDKLFQRFSRIPNEYSSVVGGTGLGLYLVKNMTELLGGTLSVESEPGKGSSFIVTLPKGDK